MNSKLVKYIETNILPEYSKNDSGHNIEHINNVIDRCMRFVEQFDNIDLDMLYAIATFHDIGHHIDKKKSRNIISKNLL